MYESNAYAFGNAHIRFFLIHIIKITNTLKRVLLPIEKKTLLTKASLRLHFIFRCFTLSAIFRLYNDYENDYPLDFSSCTWRMMMFKILMIRQWHAVCILNSFLEFYDLYSWPIACLNFWTQPTNPYFSLIFIQQVSTLIFN